MRRLFRLAIIADGDRDVVQRPGRHRHRIGQIVGPGGNDHVRLAIEAQRHARRRIDCGRSRSSRPRDAGARDPQRRAAGQVRQPHPQPITGDRRPHDLPQRPVAQRAIRQRRVAGRPELRRSPARNPGGGAALRLRGGRGHHQQRKEESGQAAHHQPFKQKLGRDKGRPVGPEKKRAGIAAGPTRPKEKGRHCGRPCQFSLGEDQKFARMPARTVRPG